MDITSNKIKEIEEKEKSVNILTLSGFSGSSKLWGKGKIILKIYRIYTKNQGGRGHWAVYYTNVRWLNNFGDFN